MSVCELYRSVIPANKVINDNHGQHYRSIQGNQQWLLEQFEAMQQGYWELYRGRGANRHLERVPYQPPCGFEFPQKDDVVSLFGSEPVVLHHEVWKLGSRRFDPHNYAHTFKAPLDALVQKGYLQDDSWKFVLRTEFTGGGYEVWKERAVRYENDGLPDEFTLNWWKDTLKAEANDIFVRTLVYTP